MLTCSMRTQNKIKCTYHCLKVLEFLLPCLQICLHSRKLFFLLLFATVYLHSWSTKQKETFEEQTNTDGQPIEVSKLLLSAWVCYKNGIKDAITTNPGFYYVDEFTDHFFLSKYHLHRYIICHRTEKFAGVTKNMIH